MFMYYLKGKSRYNRAFIKIGNKKNFRIQLYMRDSRFEI